jgi:hypothetical protein
MAMADVICPNCKTSTELLAIRRNHDEFCPSCDYPLFWVSTSLPTTRPGTTNEPTLRRLPGVGGRQSVGSKVCSNCGELNQLGETHCDRCKAELDPKPPEPIVVVIPPPPPAPEPAPIVVVVPPPTPPWWWWWPLGLIGIAIVIRIVIAIIEA